MSDERCMSTEEEVISFLFEALTKARGAMGVVIAMVTKEGETESWQSGPAATQIGLAHLLYTNVKKSFRYDGTPMPPTLPTDPPEETSA